MKKVWFILILRQVSLWLLIGAVSACSFKKEPNKPAPEIIVVEKKEELHTHPEVLILNKSEEDFTSNLDEYKVEYLQSIRSSKGENLLDLAIQSRKKKVLEYLLTRGFSPLRYSETSLQELTRNNDFFETIRSFQKPYILSLFTQLESLVEDGRLNSELKRMGFLSASCTELLEKIWENYSFISVPVHNQLFVSIRHEAVPKIITSLYQTETCASLKKTATTSDLHRWARIETLAQTIGNFSSTQLIEFILSLGKIENFYIEGISQGKIAKIDPRILTLLSKTPSDKTFDSTRDRWFEILTQVSSKDPHFYHIKYYTSKNVEEFTTEQCKLEHCLDIEGVEKSYIEASNILGLNNDALIDEVKRLRKTDDKSTESETEDSSEKSDE